MNIIPVVTITLTVLIVFTIMMVIALSDHRNMQKDGTDSSVYEEYM